MIKQDILRHAVISRSLLIVIQYIGNHLIPDHDAGVFLYVPNKNSNNLAHEIVFHLFGGFLRWDAQYFMHIAKYGYTYENTLAFFPLVPLLSRYLALILQLIIRLDLETCILLSFILINVIFFILAAQCLYELSLHFMSKDFAINSVKLFCYNPASVFFLAPYTECIFSYLSFKSMLNCIRIYKKYCNCKEDIFQVRDVTYIIPIALSTLTRSNGILNIGFLVYSLICLYLRKHWTRPNYFIAASKYLFLIIVLSILCLIPFILFQLFSYKSFCIDFSNVKLETDVLNYAKQEKFVIPGTFTQNNQSWCYSKLPLAYSYVQSHYWNVGFLKYYQLKQIPNFLLAFPIIFIILQGGFQFYKLNFRDSRRDKLIAKIFNLVSNKLISSKNRFNCSLMVFVIHAVFLTIFCLLNIHVQVTTRMLCSASPILYWFLAPNISDKFPFEIISCRFNNSNNYNVNLYFISYYVIGTILFCNFLPFT